MLSKSKLAPTLQLSQQFALDPLTTIAIRGVLPTSAVRRWVQMAIADDDTAQTYAINLRWVDEAEGRALNHQHRGLGQDKDYATNVLTFEYGVDAGVLSADIVLCWPVIVQEAQAQGKLLRNHAAHLIIHGALHALGYDHIEDDEAQAMEALETKLLARLKIADPYAEC